MHPCGLRQVFLFSYIHPQFSVTTEYFEILRNFWGFCNGFLDHRRRKCAFKIDKDCILAWCIRNWFDARKINILFSENFKHCKERTSFVAGSKDRGAFISLYAVFMRSDKKKSSAIMRGILNIFFYNIKAIKVGCKFARYCGNAFGSVLCKCLSCTCGIVIWLRIEMIAGKEIATLAKRLIMGPYDSEFSYGLYQARREGNGESEGLPPQQSWGLCK